MDEPSRHAYATLGLAPQASARDVKTRYRHLARTWHPDRFASDPTGQAEAALRMAQINRAYQLLTQKRRGQPGDGEPEPTVPPAPHQSQSPPTRLTREQIDGMVRAVGNEGPIDSLLGTLGSFGIRQQIPVDWAHPPVIVGVLACALVFIWIQSRFGRGVAEVLYWFLVLGAIAFSVLRRRRGAGW